MIERFNEVIACLEHVNTTLLEKTDFCIALDLAIRIKSMSEAVYLGVLAEIEVNDFANSLGFRTAADAVAAKSGERRGSTKRDVDLAKGIKAQSALSDAFGNGDITRSKAAEILRAEGATEEEQRALIEAAKTESTSKLHRRVEDFRAAHGQEPPKVKNSLTISRNDSGGTISASLEPVRLNTVEIALDLAIRKLGLPKDIPYDERRAEGLAAICRFFIEHVNNASSVRGSNPTCRSSLISPPSKDEPIDRRGLRTGNTSPVKQPDKCVAMLESPESLPIHGRNHSTSAHKAPGSPSPCLEQSSLETNTVSTKDAKPHRGRARFTTNTTEPTKANTQSKTVNSDVGTTTIINTPKTHTKNDNTEPTPTPPKPIPMRI
jgi:hypothetical protein